jgi:tripartite ATP-independent transporter DctP family solute receptor
MIPHGANQHAVTASLRPPRRWTYLVTGLAALALAGCGEGDGPLVLKVAHNGSPDHPYQAGFERFKEIIERDTGGAVQVQIFENGQLGTEEDASIMVKLGALAASAASAGGGLGSFVPEAEAFNLPFVFRDMPHFYRVLDGAPGQRVAEAVDERLDAIVLGWWFSGVRNTWNGDRPVRTPEDLAGLKIRVMASPVLVQAFQALGAQATPMSFGELYSALEQGVVDGAETDHVDLLYERFYEVTQYVSLTEHMYLAAALVFSRKVFDRLPEDVQAVVLRAGRESTIAQRQAMETATLDALAELQAMGTLEFLPVDRSLFQARVRAVYEANAERVGGMEVIDEIAAY